MAQLIHQGLRCALCPRAVEPAYAHKLVFDHNHATGALRGLLCVSCNTAMAGVDRGDDWLCTAVAYRDQGVWMGRPHGA